LQQDWQKSTATATPRNAPTAGGAGDRLRDLTCVSPVVRQKPVTGSRPVVVSAISLYEVWKYAATHAGEPRADQIADALRAYTVAAVDDSIALHSARLSREHKLPLADALIYATALAREATLWTQKRNLKGLPNVRYLPKVRPGG
jgi:predicted nucleic acid-binding protein